MERDEHLTGPHDRRHPGHDPLDGPPGRHHPDDIAILLAEKRHRAGGARFRQGLLLEGQLHTVEDAAVDQRLDFADLLRRQRPVMREIESQPVRRDERALLMDVLAQYLTKGRVQKVGRGVIPFRIATPVARDDGSRLPKVYFPGDFAERGDAAVDPAHFVDVDAPTFALNLAAIGDLATGLDVEWCFAQHYGDASIGKVSFGNDFSIYVEGIVADEHRRLAVLRPITFAEHVLGDADLFRAAVLLRLGALRL